MNIDTFLKKEAYFHLLLWVVVLFYPYVEFSEETYRISFLHELNGLFFKVLISYVLYLYIFPRKQQKSIFLLGILTVFINPFLFELTDTLFHDEPYMTLKDYMNGLAIYVGFGVFFYGLFIFKTSIKKQMEINRLTHEKQQAELENLKAQVNPHFLFNTLNTIYARAIKTDEKTADLIMKLSNGLRYFFAEGKQEMVSIEQEMAHLKDYVDLQDERLSKKVNVDFTSHIDDMNERIAPLLLITFVENAFKYTSILKGNQHSISISIRLVDKHLLFTCRNPYVTHMQQDSNEWIKSGIGLANTKQRLQLMYPNRHQLVIDQSQGFFNVTLSIQL